MHQDTLKGAETKFSLTNKSRKSKNTMKMNTENLIADLQASFCPFGYRDVERAATVIEEAGFYNSDLVEAIESFCEDTDTKLSSIDPVYCAYDFIFQTVRSEIEEKTGKDVLNDTDKQIDVHGNYMCSSFDYTEEAKGEFMDIVNRIEPKDRSVALNWIIEELG